VVIQRTDGYVVCADKTANKRRMKMTARVYAQIVGVVVILIGVVGLILGDQSLGGLLNIDILEDIIHLVTGGLLAYVGFAHRDEGLARNVVGGLGVVYLLVGVLGFVIPMLFGLLPHGYSIVDNLIHLALGVAGIVVGFLVPRRGTTASTS
jgi:hypothetical protein